MRKILKTYAWIGLAVFFQACGEATIPDPNPGGYTGLDVEININQSPYTDLKNVGGSYLYSTYKVMIARVSNNGLDADFAVVSSGCPNDASLTMKYNAANKTFTCGSAVFNTEGKAQSGTSTDLKRYRKSFTVNSGTLRIFE